MSPLNSVIHGVFVHLFLTKLKSQIVLYIFRKHKMLAIQFIFLHNVLSVFSLLSFPLQNDDFEMWIKLH